MRHSTAGPMAFPPFGSSVARRRFTNNWKHGRAIFLGMEDRILYSSCLDANGGLFETLLDAQDSTESRRPYETNGFDGYFDPADSSGFRSGGRKSVVWIWFGKL